jgi:hypothetical protein
LLRLGSGSLIDGWRHDGSDRNGRGLVDRNNWSFVGRRWLSAGQLVISGPQLVTVILAVL